MLPLGLQVRLEFELFEGRPQRHQCRVRNLDLTLESLARPQLGMAWRGLVDIGSVT